MKDKRVFFNPIRMLSPKLDSEAIKIEELYQSPVSDSLTLEEGLLVMLSKIIEMTRLVNLSFSSASMNEVDAAASLAAEVHELEKLLTEKLACAITDPPEMCRAVILFPSHLERVGDYLESILNCCRIRCQYAVPFVDKAVAEIGEMFKLLIEIMTNFRDAFIRPNKILLENVVQETKKLDQLCQDLQLSHVERLLSGSTAPRASSLYLDILESTQSVNRHIRDMADKILALMTEVHRVG
jgi:Na+/phosphate symporter